MLWLFCLCTMYCFGYDFQDLCTVPDHQYQITMHGKAVSWIFGQGTCLNLRNLECHTCQERLWVWSLWLVVGRVSSLGSIAALSWCFLWWNIHWIYLFACTSSIWNHTHIDSTLEKMKTQMNWFDNVASNWSRWIHLHTRSLCSKKSKVTPRCI